jgi:hypothetical protein
MELFNLNETKDLRNKMEKAIFKKPLLDDLSYLGHI